MKIIERKIHQIDADGRPLGRLAVEIAMLLRGKNKASFLPNLDAGDAVEVVNGAKIKFTGRKLSDKEYKWHTMYPGGLRSKKMGEVFAKDPGEVLRRAVYGMLPKNKLRDLMIKRLKVTK